MVLTNFILLILFSLIQLTRIDTGEQEKAPQFIWNPQTFEKINLGFQMLTAKVFWLQYLYRIDTPYENKEERSWQYHAVHAVTSLDPSFRTAFRMGGETLSVIIDDKMGAKDIFDKGVALYPDYWSLTYSAGYHYAFELKDYSRASELFLLSQKHGAPEWLMALAGKMYSESGNLELAIRVLEDFIQRYPESTALEIAKGKLAELYKQRDGLQ